MRKREQAGYTYFEGLHFGKPFLVGKLYNTNVVSYDDSDQTLQIQDGGWATPSTVKAVNRTLERIGLDQSVRARIHKREFRVQFVEEKWDIVEQSEGKIILRRRS